tara:strand:+ start:13942 stop:14895 length:954 start_codon:yes stop_codon:yes gene_type:complete
MPLSQWNLEFLNHNAQRSYPLTDESTKTDTTNSFTIPDDFIVGFGLPVSTAMDMESGRFFIRQIGAFASGYQLTIAYDSGTEVNNVGTALIPATNVSRNTTFAVGGIEPFDDIVGKIVIGRVDTIVEQPTGLYAFDLEDSRLEPAVIQPMIRSLTGIRISNSSGTTSEVFHGDIELVAGSNMQISTASSATETQIIFSALDGEGTIETCVCEGEATATPCIKTINGVSPTTDGNFNFIGDDCLSFVGTSSGLKVTDSCCAPCCGCEELESITRDLELFNVQRGELTLFVNTLAAEATAFGTTVLGARLGDRRCLTCE